MPQIVIELNSKEMLRLLKLAETSKKSEEDLCREAILHRLNGIEVAEVKERRPKQLLARRPEWEARRQRLEEPHIHRLTQFVHDIREELGLAIEIPFFDPDGGGVNAEVLFVLETPGPVAFSTGFISYDNPDPTARNFSKFLQDAEIMREKTLMWNLVPWYLGETRSPNTKERRDGLKYLVRLLSLLPNLKAIVCLGSHAQKAVGELDLSPDVKILKCPHPSGRVLITRPEAATRILSAFRDASAALKR